MEGGRRQRITAPSGGDGGARRQRKAGTACGSRRRRGRAGELVGGERGGSSTRRWGGARGGAGARRREGARGGAGEPVGGEACRRPAGGSMWVGGATRHGAAGSLAPAAAVTRSPATTASGGRTRVGWGRVGEILLVCASRSYRTER